MTYDQFTYIAKTTWDHRIIAKYQYPLVQHHTVGNHAIFYNYIQRGPVRKWIFNNQ